MSRKLGSKADTLGSLFLKLYSILVVVVAIYIVGIVNLNSILQSTLERHFRYLAQGSIYLLEERLATTPLEQWPALVDEVNQGDGYIVRLIAVESLKFDRSVMNRLNNGAIVITDKNDIFYSYKKIYNSEWVLEFPFSQSEYSHNQRLSNSTFNLIEMSLREKPQHTWPNIINNLGKRFNFPVILLKQDQIELPPSQLLELANGIVVWQSIDDLLYHRIGDSQYVVSIGPFDEPLTLDYLETILMLVLAFLVAMAVMFWVYPLWRDLKQLGVSAKAFGRGNFSVRAPLPRRSVLHRLSETFNGMAGRIEGLISSHKELTNAVSHELRTPIARLRFGMEMLENSSDETARTRYINSMNADINELDQLVGELLTYARFDRDKPALKFQRQEIKPWLTDVIQHSQMGKEDLSIEFEIVGNEHHYARFEPRLLARALGNLLQNAKRYALSKIHVTFSNENDQFLICVDDDGPGIPENEREYIFEAFKRLDASRDRGTGGYGLGLAIVQRICQWHGGEVVVMDSPLGGARFVVRWPENDATRDIN